MHALYSLAKDSVLFGRWAHDLAIDLRLPAHAMEIIRAGADFAISAYRSLVWPLFSWVDVALRDIMFVLVVIYGPTIMTGIYAIYQSARGGSGNPIFRAAANRQFYVQSLVSIIVGVRALDEPESYFYVTAMLCFLTPLQFIRHLDYRLPFHYGFKESRDTVVWYILVVGVPFLFVYPTLKAEPQLSAISLAVGATVMLATSLLLTARDIVWKRTRQREKRP